MSSAACLQLRPCERVHEAAPRCDDDDPTALYGPSVRTRLHLRDQFDSLRLEDPRRSLHRDLAVPVALVV